MGTLIWEANQVPFVMPDPEINKTSILTLKFINYEHVYEKTKLVNHEHDADG